MGYTEEKQAEINPPVPLVRLDKDGNPSEVIAYACGKCRFVVAGIGKGGGMFPTAESAEEYTARHCGPWVCEKCGAEHKRSYQPTCRKCFDQAWAERSAKREAELYEKAEKVPISSYEGPLYWDGAGCGDGFFGTLDDLLDHCACEDIRPPDYVWGCAVIHPSLRFEDLCEQALDDHHESCELDAEDELREFLDQWNAKQTGESWEPRHSKVLIIEYPCEGWDGTRWID